MKLKTSLFMALNFSLLAISLPAYAKKMILEPNLDQPVVAPNSEDKNKSLNNQKKVKLNLLNSKGTIKNASENSFDTPDNWFNLSSSDGVEGVGTEKAYELFGIGQSNAEVVVAVIDSGVDVNHEDLQSKIWINNKEVANNGIDDDKNGYVDDVFGWNFIGGKNGMATIEPATSLGNKIKLIPGNPAHQINSDSLEVTRELVRMKKLQADLTLKGKTLSKKDAQYLVSLTDEVNSTRVNAQSTLSWVKDLVASFKANLAILRSAGFNQEPNLENLNDFQATGEAQINAKNALIASVSSGRTLAYLEEVQNYYNSQLEHHYNENFNPRSIVGDNYADQNERHYGNNDVIGPDSSHGTHVAGIIAANRSNEIGIKGVATQVKIMAIRVVPDGDERDKDVANGIRYAVDNGAKVINMSFGKSYSPYKKVVDAALRYASSKGVLLVHAAGNSNQNNDENDNFPNPKHTLNLLTAKNWIEVGASSYQRGLNLPADFTNYGKKSVNIFAPGVDILSSTPNNQYDTYSGTSMAAPVVSGVAAAIIAHQPKLSIKDLTNLIYDSARDEMGQDEVLLPGSTTEKVFFSWLSKDGSIIDLHNALKLLKQ
jgi:subtilisin family serine protease